MRIIREKSVGLVIDIQERLFPAMHKGNRLLERTEKLIRGMNELAVPILITQQYTKGLGATIPEIARLIPSFSPIEKVAFSCYDEPAFVEALESHDIENVILCGIESHVCVLQTAIDLKMAGYRPVVVADCITSRSKNDLKTAIQRLTGEGITITGMESVLFEMTRSSKAPEFKALSGIVK